jgi:hypothetical protein
VNGNRAGQRGALLLATGKLAGVVIRQVGDAAQIQRLANATG